MPIYIQLKSVYTALNNADYIYVQESVSSSYDMPDEIYDCEGNEKYKCGENQPVDSFSNFFSKAQKIKILWKNNGRFNTKPVSLCLLFSVIFCF